jgi:hypothetical protein
MLFVDTLLQVFAAKGPRTKTRKSWLAILDKPLPVAL